MSQTAQSATTLTPEKLKKQETPDLRPFKYRVPRLDEQVVEFPDAEPDISRMPITHLDLDTTEKCNLRCSYCFKGELSNKSLTLDTAKQAIRFLVKYSDRAREIGIGLLGGEPLLAFPLLKEWIPWTRRYCEQRDKKLKICVTTNGTVFGQTHREFFRAWKVGLHLSIDGVPEVQNLERKFANGKGSSDIVEKNLPNIFRAWRTVYARSTVVPETVHKLLESYKYLCDKGFYKVVFCFAYSKNWDDPNILRTVEQQFRKVLEYHWEYMKQQNRYFVFSLLDRYVEGLTNPQKIETICGAGRANLGVDIDGLLWPCHRFGSSLLPHKNLILGSVWGGFNNTLRDCFLKMNPCEHFRQPCKTCEDQIMCLSGCVAANWQDNHDIYDVGPEYCKVMRILHTVCREHVEKVKKEDPDQWNKYMDWVANYQW